MSAPSGRTKDSSSDEAFRSDLTAEYAALVRVVSDYDGRLITIKGWSVTVSLAALGLGFQQQHAALFALAALTGALFWVVEAITKSHQIRYYPRMRQIEAWSARLNPVHIDGDRMSAPRVDAAWTAAGAADPGAAMRCPPREMTTAEIRRMRRRCAWLPHVMLPSVVAVLVGVGLTAAASTGLLDIPL